MRMNKSSIAGLAFCASLISSAASAETVEIKVVVTKFDPAVAFVKPGDTVKFTNMAGHDTVSVDGMIPEGAQGWKSAMGEELAVTLDKEGVYIYKCSPHVSLGMAGAIVVGEGDPANLEQVRKSPENKGMIARTVRQLEAALKERPAP